MNKQLIFIAGGIFIAVTLLIGVVWGWVSVLAFLIGLSLLACVVLGRYALLKLYLKRYSLQTVLYTNPFSAILYSFVDPHSKKETSDLDEFFPSKKRREPESTDELPPLHFTDTVEETRKENNDR